MLKALMILKSSKEEEVEEVLVPVKSSWALVFSMRRLMFGVVLQNLSQFLASHKLKMMQAMTALRTKEHCSDLLIVQEVHYSLRVFGGWIMFVALQNHMHTFLANVWSKNKCCEVFSAWVTYTASRSQKTASELQLIFSWDLVQP